MTQKIPEARSKPGEARRKLSPEPYVLRLYVAGKTPKSLRTIENVQRVCRTYLRGRCRLTIVDLRENPLGGWDDQILAIPTLIKESPEPFKRIIGDLSDVQQTLLGLNLSPQTQ